MTLLYQSGPNSKVWHINPHFFWQAFIMNLKYRGLSKLVQCLKYLLQAFNQTKPHELRVKLVNSKAVYAKSLKNCR